MATRRDSWAATLAVAMAALLLWGCGVDNSVSARRAEAKLQPDAGEDRTVLVGETVTLDGSASTGSGGPLRFQWESLSKRVVLDSPTAVVTRFVPSEPAVYPFLLWVSSRGFDDTWVSGHVVVTVRAAAGPPAGLGRTLPVPAGFTVVGLDGASVPDNRFASEAPGAVVSLDAFQIDRYEVTNGEYREFLGTNPRRHDFDDVPGFSGPLQPVVGVNWDDAAAYCGWRGKRLPSEVEWERAARGFDAGTASARLAPVVSRYRAAFGAASNRAQLRDSGAGDAFVAEVLAMVAEVVAEAAEAALYPWGGEPPDAAQANVGGQIAGNVRRTVDVGSYPLGRSAVGADDMAGNAWEWTADWFDERLYTSLRRDVEGNLNRLVRAVETAKQSNSSFPAIALSDIAVANPRPADPNNLATATKVLRGGSWIDGDLGVRSTSRGAALPGLRTNHIGFRCAR